MTQILRGRAVALSREIGRMSGVGEKGEVRFQSGATRRKGRAGLISISGDRGE